jgi:hypothetical protein
MPDMKRASLRIRFSTSVDDLFSIKDMTDTVAEPEGALLTSPSWEKMWAKLRDLDVGRRHPRKRMRLDGDVNRPTYLLIVPSWTLDFDFNLDANLGMTTDVRVHVGKTLPLNHPIRVNPAEHAIFVRWGEMVDPVQLRKEAEADIRAYDALFSDIQPLPDTWEVDSWLQTNFDVNIVSMRTKRGLKELKVNLGKFSDRLAGKVKTGSAYAEHLLAHAVPLLTFDRVMLDMYGDLWHTILCDFRKKSIKAAVQHLRNTYRPTQDECLKLERSRRWHASCAHMYAKEMNALLSTRHPRLFRDLSRGDGLFWVDDEMGMEDLLTISLATSRVICGQDDTWTLDDFRPDAIEVPRDRMPNDATKAVRDLTYSIWGSSA